jgi:Uma2 family endonuclease
MNAVPKRQPISEADYLAGELISRVKHEYRAGYVYAMAGAKVVHNRIATNVIVALGKQLAGKPCQPFNSDMKIRVNFSNQLRFYYPDVSVICESNPPDDSYQERPRLVVEVISPSTRRIDEGEKLEAYLSLSSLAVYMLVEPSQPAVVVYRREGQSFTRTYYEDLNSVIALPEIEAELSLADIYANVEFVPEPSEDEEDVS